MGSGASTSSSATETNKPAATNVVNSESASTEKKPPCKACCACPETKKARDAW